MFQACLYRINRRAVHTWPITTFFMRLWLTIIWQKWVQLQQQEWGFGGIRGGFGVGMKLRRGRKLSLSGSESGRRISLKKKKASRLILFSFKTTSYLVYFSFMFLNTFIMTASMSLFPKSNIWAISGRVSIDCLLFFPCLRVRFSCFSCPVIFYCILDIMYLPNFYEDYWFLF